MSRAAIETSLGRRGRRRARDRRASPAPARRRAFSGSAAFAPTCRAPRREALDLWAAEEGRAATRFDYSGHGSSGGRFEDGTISRWLEEAEAVFDAFTTEPQVLVGSSMGGWLALLLAKRLAERGDGDRLHGMVLLAPAVDMTKDLMWDTLAARRSGGS